MMNRESSRVVLRKVRDGGLRASARFACYIRPSDAASSRARRWVSGESLQEEILPVLLGGKE
jgi:hypothetical protein